MHAANCHKTAAFHELECATICVQMLPFLGPVLGRGKLGNFLIRNKWRNYQAIRKIGDTPILMLSAGQARSCSQSVVCSLLTAE